jgi:hypothetical protein
MGRTKWLISIVPSKSIMISTIQNKRVRPLLPLQMQESKSIRAVGKVSSTLGRTGRGKQAKTSVHRAVRLIKERIDMSK